MLCRCAGQVATRVEPALQVWFNWFMIPLRLRLAGFLSYRDPVELDFSLFDLACISGQNGAGKSSLLDAITWVLFGQARKRDETLINNHPEVKTASVDFTFEYEGSVYHVQRALSRGKPARLEFQIQHVPGEGQPAGWRPLTERTLRETQSRIEQVLRLDYETFVNAAFFLQGKADQFTRQSPSKRKEILGSILGLDTWEEYRLQTAERRKSHEKNVETKKALIGEINAELEQESERKTYLADLENRLEQLSTIRKAQEKVLENVKQVVARLEDQRKLVETWAGQMEQSRQLLEDQQIRLVERQAQRKDLADRLSQAGEVEAAFHAWQSFCKELEKWNVLAEKFSQHEKHRHPLLVEIETQRARIEQEKAALLEQRHSIDEQSSTMGGLQVDLDSTRETLTEIEKSTSQRGDLETELQSAREKSVELRSTNDRLKGEMEETKGRIDGLEQAEGAVCPLCGQPLKARDRTALVRRLKQEGKAMGDLFRANRSALDQLQRQVIDLEARLAELTPLDTQRLENSTRIAQLTERLDGMSRAVKDWKKMNQPRLDEITQRLKREDFATETRLKLVRVDGELASLGYDAAAHDRTRKAELESRPAEGNFRGLELARAALKPLEEEITSLRTQIKTQKTVVRKQQKEHDAASSSLAVAETQQPDLETAERTLFGLQEDENRLNQEVGAARQKVTVLDDLRLRKEGLNDEVEELKINIGRCKQLERAFSKDGVPALLIEQALPEIESHANELLDRLSGGMMSVRFATQTKYKDEKREDLKETLDIQISDGSRLRDYETFSGGEAFRVDFAIRLALSRLLAQRKGARLQTLVVDEGFSSQDAQGRQRLVEAINAVRENFAKILIITHLDELKDAFPARIEVEKTDRGSTLRLI